MTTLRQNKTGHWTWAEADQLLKAHGGAVYLLDLDHFESNCNSLLDAFHRFYPNTTLGYSYKTNYTPALCQKANGLGCYAEVVSRMELDLAVRLGVRGDRIIFNGPVKSSEDLALAIDLGAMLHLDNVAEWELVEEIATRSDQPLKLAIRCNFPLANDHRSRFGFDATTGEVQSIAQRIRRHSNCRLVGLHCHFSHHRDAQSYRVRAEQMVRLSQELFPKSPPQYLDIGGGYCGPMPDELSAQFASPVPSYADYAGAVGSVMETAFGASGPELILEPGMGIIADCMKFVTQITATKIIRGKRFAVTPGNIYNIKPSLNLMNLPLQIIRKPNALPVPAAVGPTEIVGSTCMEIDVMYRDLRQPVDVGDVLIFGNVGAYTTSLLPPFIRPAPAMLAHEGGSTRLIRRAQTMDDVTSTYVF